MPGLDTIKTKSDGEEPRQVSQDRNGPLCKSAEESIERDYEKFGDFFVAREQPPACTDLEVNNQVE